MKYIIIDWACNRPYGYKFFDSFDDAWEFIYIKFPDQESFDDFYVELYNDVKKYWL